MKKMFLKLPAYPLKNHQFSIFLGKSENSDMPHVQIGTTHAKNNIFSKVQKILKNQS